MRSTVRRLIDPDAPGPHYTGLLGLVSYVEVDPGLQPGTMVFAFGKRAYYLYWTLADGRVARGANLPSKKSQGAEQRYTIDWDEPTTHIV